VPCEGVSGLSAGPTGSAASTSPSATSSPSSPSTPPVYLALYPEYVLPDASGRPSCATARALIVGRKLADKFGWKVGDQIPLRGTIYPGTWSFTLRGIYDGVDASTDEQQLLLHWKLPQRDPSASAGPQTRRGDSVGVYVVGIDEPDDAALISQRIDALFRNSLAETLTETEKAFQLSFVSMSEAILVAIQAVSLIIVVIIMAVMANTMTMTARERLAEYATLSVLGFSPGFVVRLLPPRAC
jgi:putative ABC transport system permease protein